MTEFAENRYERIPYRRCWRSGLDLPAISHGLWHNFADDVPFDRLRSLCRRAFDLGITRFDFANNHSPPPGAADENFGRLLKGDFAAHRDALIISTKGWLSHVAWALR